MCLVARLQEGPACIQRSHILPRKMFLMFYEYPTTEGPTKTKIFGNKDAVHAASSTLSVSCYTVAAHLLFSFPLGSAGMPPTNGLLITFSFNIFRQNSKMCSQVTRLHGRRRTFDVSQENRPSKGVNRSYRTTYKSIQCNDKMTPTSLVGPRRDMLPSHMLAGWKLFALTRRRHTRSRQPASHYVILRFATHAGNKHVNTCIMTHVRTMTSSL